MYMFFFAKSKQLKALGKVGIIPAIFGINEPVLFGTPIAMNPMLAIPFIGMPVIACLIQYFALYTGCLLYTSDAADDLLCVDLGGRRIIKKKKNRKTWG